MRVTTVSLTTVRTTLTEHATAAKATVTGRPETLVTTMMSASYAFSCWDRPELPAAIMTAAYIAEAAIHNHRERAGHTVTRGIQG